ncbi:MAG: hypothetical protein ACTTH0_04265 [Eubacteriales bacterium]
MFKIIEGNLRKKVGSLTLETAILLPFVIIAVLSLSFMLKINSANEAVVNMACDEARRLAIHSYAPIGKIEALGFSDRLEKRIVNENSEIFDVSVKRFLYRYKRHAISNLISFDVEYSMQPKLGMPMAGTIFLKEHILTRAFVGQDDYVNPKSFELMQEEEESQKVWVFPRAGEKYHCKNCRYIQNYATRTVLNRQTNLRFKPCKLCNAKALKKGATIYCFYKSGDVYHCGSCKAVDKYVIEMEKVEAEKRGFSACSVCGGV